MRYPQIRVHWQVHLGGVHQWPKKQQGQACLPAPAGVYLPAWVVVVEPAGADMGRHEADRLRYLPRLDRHEADRLRYLPQLGRHKACPYFSLASVATVAFFIFSSSLKGLILMVRV